MSRYSRLESRVSKLEDEVGILHQFPLMGSDGKEVGYSNYRFTLRSIVYALLDKLELKLDFISPSRAMVTIEGKKKDDGQGNV